MARYFKNTYPDYVPGSAVIGIEKNKLLEIMKKYIADIIRGHEASVSNCDGGLYVGCAGIAYTLYYLAKSADFTSQRADYLLQAHKYASVSLTYSRKQATLDPTDGAAFILGGAGVNAVSSAIFHEVGEVEAANQCASNYVQTADLCSQVSYLRHGSDEMLVGRAGYICGLLWLRHVLLQEILPESKVHPMLDAMIESGVKYSKHHKSPCPLMYAYYNTEYIGAGHGLAGILYTFLNFPEYLSSNKRAAGLVRESVDFLLSLEQPDGNYAPAMDEVGYHRSDADELVHWCHGAPGVIYMLAKAYQVYKDEKYLNACKRCGDLVWLKGLLKKGPGICHGVAGSGLVFLLLYRLTSDQLYLHRAWQFAKFLISDEFTHTAKRPDTPYSLYEGLSGTVCFLHDMLHPHKAHFPFMDVFLLPW